MQFAPLTREDCRNYIERCLFGSLPGAQSISPEGGGRVGLELEAFPYLVDGQHRVLPVQLLRGKDAFMHAMISECGKNGGSVQYLDPSQAHAERGGLVAAIHFPDGSNINFEPGLQTEISTPPCDSMTEMAAKLADKQQILQALEVNHSFRFAQCGTHPWCAVNEIGMQINKTRYRVMARYFDSLGPYGEMMMLQTCSLQVNLDMGADSDTRAKRIVAANLLAPFATALFANSSVTAGKLNGHQSYRSYIWQHLDTTRTGLLPVDQFSGKMDQAAIVDAYLDFALKAPVIFIEDFGDEVFPSQVTMQYWLTHPVKGVLPSLAHFKHHLTLLFPEVRLKGYLELRSVDAPPPAWQLVPALFYCGLLYNDAALNNVLDLLLPVAAQMPYLMHEATYGLQSDRLYAMAIQLMQMSVEGYVKLPDLFTGDTAKQLILFNESYTEQRRTFADDLREKFLAGNILLSC